MIFLATFVFFLVCSGFLLETLAWMWFCSVYFLLISYFLWIMISGPNSVKWDPIVLYLIVLDESWSNSGRPWKMALTMVHWNPKALEWLCKPSQTDRCQLLFDIGPGRSEYPFFVNKWYDHLTTAFLHLIGYVCLTLQLVW